jgi:predicted nucleic acid-binding protein
MILVDTSVWIRFLAGREPYASGLDDLLTRDDVTGHDLIFGELLIGDRGGRATLLRAYALMHHAAVVPHAEVVEFVRRRRLSGRGIGWLDVNLLASALVGGLRVWTADARFAAAVEDLQLSYQNSGS